MSNLDYTKTETFVSVNVAANVGVNVAVVGCGYWGKNLVRNFKELEALTHVCDNNSAQAEAMALQYNVQSASFEDILANPAIAGVVIATPPILHAKLAKEALEAGKHVFVEKPLALKVSDAEQLCELAERRDRRLMVGHILSYHPAFLALLKMVREGQLGRLHYIYSNRLNFGQIRRQEDILWSFAPHDISMILALVGSEPDHVSAVGGFYLHKSIADITTTHLSFPGGEQAHIFVSWLHPFKEQKLIVVGDKGMAVFDDGQPWECKLQHYPQWVEWKEGMPLPNRAQAIAIAIDKKEPLREECQHFLECIKHGITPRTDGREGLRVLKVLDKASEKLTAKPNFTDVQIHESTYVDENVTIGSGTKIWHFSHLLPGTAIGKNCIIGQNVSIGPDVTVGDYCKIQNNVSLYKGVTLEDGVFCGPSSVFTNVNTPRAEINRQSEFLKTHVGRGATIGANATIVCGNTIGAYSFIAAGAVVTKPVQPYALMAGVPARQIGWVSEAGEKLSEDLICQRTGQKYRINDVGQLEKIILAGIKT